MRHFPALLGAPLLLIFAAACAAPAYTAPGTLSPTIRVQTPAGTMDLPALTDEKGMVLRVAAPPDHIWKVLPRLFAALEIPAAVIAPGEAFGNPTLRVTREFAGERPSLALSCGRTPLGRPAADEYPVQLALLIGISPVGTQIADVQILLDGFAEAPAGDTRHACTTTGRFERRLVELIEASRPPLVDTGR